MTAPPTDEALFAAYVAGDTEAFRTLFLRFAPRVRRALQRGLPPDMNVDDLVQQAFLLVHRARHDFDPARPLSPWLMTVALNVKRQKLRRLKLERAHMTPLREDAPVGTVAPHDPVRADDARRLHSALGALPDSQSQAIEMHWLMGLSFPEIAEAVGASVSAVKVRAHRGYKALRTLLSDSGGNRGGRSGTLKSEPDEKSPG